MTQILVTLDNGADAGLLRRMIENMKGVLEAKLSNTDLKTTDGSAERWFNQLEALRMNYDSSYIDLEDERTRYILSK